MGAAPLPLATLAVNLVGSALLGFALVRLVSAGRTRAASLVCTGLLGAMTTFSTFAVEVLALLGEQPMAALAYAALSLAGGQAAAHAGLRLGRARA